MENNSTVDILKTAILMEKRGKAFYEKVAEQTSDPDIKNIFNIMAQEELTHVHQLSMQFAHYQKNNSFQKPEEFMAKGEDAIANMILNDEIKNKISAASFEAAAISAAIDMETKAIEVYSKQAEITTDANEKAMYIWLADFERGHHKMLNELNKELTEKIWFDNDFWPF
ncbi:MAG: ferritin family protein [Bacteroidota bacterium]